jgi:hypothetical protein
MYMADIKSSDIVIPQPAVSSLSGNAAAYESSEVTPVTGLTKGGKRKGSKGKKTVKKRTAAKRKTAKKCWWKFF